MTDVTGTTPSRSQWQGMHILKSYIVSGISLSIMALITSTAFAQQNLPKADPYEGFKVPPQEISSKTQYKTKYVNILGSKMAYVEAGQGSPILFLHGEPTSSYLWRNIMPHLQKQGRVIAPDNIGFGKSAQPELDYTFGDHYRYFEAFVKKLNLTNITLVVHDWGSGLGLNYARLHPDNVKAIVTMESIIAPLMPAKSYDALPPGLNSFFRTVRAPKTGRKLLIDDNYFIEGALPGFMVRPLAKETHDIYRAPFLTKKSRIQINQWPNEMPIGHVPEKTHDIVTAYNAWLAKTEINRVREQYSLILETIAL